MKSIYLLIFLSLFLVNCSDDGDIPVKPIPEPVQKTIPKVQTIDLSEIDQESAKSGGKILNTGNATILKKGVCWGLETSPTINDNTSAEGTGEGNFESTIENLTPYSTYYVRAYATNSEGTGYGEEIIFRTLQINLGKSAIILKTIDGGETWTQVTIDNMYRTRSSFFVDDQIGYAVGEIGTINKTTDGGDTWELQSWGAYILNSIFFIDEYTGWAVANSGTILHTNDGGMKWEEQESPYNQGLTSVYFTDKNNGMAVGPNGVVLKTTNGGEKWNMIETPASTMNAVIFTSNDVGFAGGSREMIKTTDGGNSWTSQYKTGYAIQDFHVLNEETIYSAHSQGYIFRTIDGGENWEELAHLQTYRLRSICFANSKIGYVAGDGGDIFKTTDGGENWTEQDSGINRYIYSIHFFDENKGLAFGLFKE